MPTTFLLVFLFDLVVIAWIFKIIGCGTVVIIYFICDRLFAPNGGSMMLMIWTVPINIINAIMAINPILLNSWPFPFIVRDK